MISSLSKIATYLLFPTFVTAQSVVTDVVTFSDSSIHIEGITISNKQGTFYVGGVNTGELYEVSKNSLKRYPVPAEWPVWSMLGMKADARRQLIFISRAALPQSRDTIDAYNASDIIVFDTRHKTFIKRIPMTDRTGKVVFNDIAFAANGRLLVSDGGRPGGIYELDHKEGFFRQLNTKGIRSPQGIVATDSVIYIASYTEGIFRYNIRQDTAVFLPIPGLKDELKFIDGLALYKNNLIGICNGSQRSVIAIDLKTLKGSVLADLKLPKYNEPTLCFVLDDTLFFISNSQWESYGLPGQTKPVRQPAIISTLKLNQAFAE